MGNIARISLLVFLGLPLLAQGPVFTKTLKKVNGVPVSTNPASLTNGDLLDWVITYQYNGTAAAQLDIKDVLPPTLQYLTGSLQAPPALARQWLSGSSWLTAEPAAAAGVGAKGIAPFGAGQTALLPAPPVGSISTTALGGDGYQAIPFGGKVYVVNHHTNNRYLDCFDVTTGAACSGYPYHVPLTAGSPFVAATAQNNVTPGKTDEYLDRATGRLFFPVEKINTTAPHDLGFLCADLVNRVSCGFYPLAVFTGSSTTSSPDVRSFQGIGAVGKRAYMMVPNGRIACLDTTLLTPAPCLGQPYPVSTSTHTQYGNSSEILGTRIFSLWQTSATAPFTVTCFDAATNLPCAGWGTKTPDLGGILGILYPLLTATGAPSGICALTTDPPGGLAPPPVVPPPSVFQCYDASSGAAIPAPATYATWARTFSGGHYQVSGYGQPGTYNSRVFNSSRVIGQIGCYDFATSAPCAGAWPVTNTALRHYATIADPERPGCMWYYGDDRKLGAFQAADGRPCSGTTTVDTIVTPALSYCDGDTVTAWDKLLVSGVSLGGGVTATLTLYDGNNPTTLAMTAGGTPFASNLTVTALPVSLGTGGLGIGYGTGPGNYKSLRVVLQFNGITSAAAWSATPPPFAEVTWTGGAPQICFRTRVATCTDAPVTNQATAVTTPAGGAPITSTAPNPPFSVAHLPGSECPAKLTIKKLVNGTPAGFAGTFKFNVTCATPGGLVQQQVSLAWPGSTVSFVNIPAGSTCTVSEDPALPPLSAPYAWTGVPVSNPASGVVLVTTGGKNEITFTNTARLCNDEGRVKITKVLQDPPPGFSGTFTFNVTCWSGTALITKQGQVTLPGSPTVYVGGIPTGSSCTVTETGPLPALPSGWFWLPPLYSPAGGQVSLTGTCCPEVVVTNRPKFCCEEKQAY